MKPDPELAAKRKRRAQASRKRMQARGINLHKWDTAKRRTNPPNTPA